MFFFSADMFRPWDVTAVCKIFKGVLWFKAKAAVRVFTRFMRVYRVIMTSYRGFIGFGP